MLILIGLLTRIASLQVASIMMTAIVTTKLPILSGHDFAGFQVGAMDRYGFWAMAHEARTDWAMLLARRFS